eukprot:6226450-Alexandrium_andersonii.AAC.1
MAEGRTARVPQQTAKKSKVSMSTRSGEGAGASMRSQCSWRTRSEECSASHLEAPRESQV